ncbi:MAG: SMI1/KNR4 family protein [Polyangiaceae bacterium]|nr:SMI1/KNR4 family protein [Polyangiaceae bacterium]
MRMKIENPHGATSRKAIAQFETRRGVLLPAEYKAFLLKSNGGWPTPNVFEVPEWHGHGNAVMSFYGIHDGEKVDRLEWACEVYDERIPADLIPIADDANGNAICIGWKGEREGKIYFWDHEDEIDENGCFRQDYRNVYLMANSLQEFLDNLMTHEDYDKRPRPKRT